MRLVNHGDADDFMTSYVYSLSVNHPCDQPNTPEACSKTPSELLKLILRPPLLSIVHHIVIAVALIVVWSEHYSKIYLCTNTHTKGIDHHVIIHLSLY